MTDYANWMGNMASSIGSKYLWQVGLPGTHDSGTEPIDNNSKLGPDATDQFKEVYKHYSYYPFGRMTAGEYFSGWCRSQKYNTADQLKMGIRYFDLRACKKSDADEVWITHSLLAQPIADVCWAVKDFLKKHPKEIVILDLNHFAKVGQDLHTEFGHWLMDTFGDLLIPPTFEDRRPILAGGANPGPDLGGGGNPTDYEVVTETKITLRDKTINDIWQTPGRVVFIYQNVQEIKISGSYDKDKNVYTPGPFPKFWPKQFIDSKWPQTMDNDDLKKSMDDNMELRQQVIKERQAKNQVVPFFVLQCQNTPTSDGCTAANGITNPMAPHSLYGLAQRTTPVTTKHIKTYKGKSVNCFITDFFELADYVDTILAFNN